MTEFSNHNLKTIYNWPEKYQIIIFIMTGILTVLLGFWWDISSIELKLTDARKQEMLLKDEVRSAIKKERDTEIYIQRLPTTKMLLAQWKSQLTRITDIPEALNEILKVGADSRLYFGLFDPGERISTGMYPVLPVKMVVVGNYHQLSSFLSHLSSLPRLIGIREFSFSNENKPDILGKPLADRANMENLLTAFLQVNINIYQEKAFYAPQKSANPKK